MDKLGLPIDALGLALAITVVGVGGWLLQTWLRIKHGYPLDGAWGQAIYLSSDREAAQRIKLLTTEHAQLRAELGSVKDRLENVERIVADRPSRLAKAIDALGIDKGGNA